MSSIQVADQTFIAAPPERVAELLSSRAQWRRWFSDLELEVREDRGPAGFRWGVSGQLVGTMEVWLEPVMDGTIAHYFLHCEPVGVSPSMFTASQRFAGQLVTVRHIPPGVLVPVRLP